MVSHWTGSRNISRARLRWTKELGSADIPPHQSAFSQLLHSPVDLLLRVDLNLTGGNNIDGGCNVTDEGAEGAILR